MADSNANNRGVDYWKHRLRDSLLKLHKEIHKSEEEDRKSTMQLESWQEQWAEKKGQISQRLAMIEEHLERHFTSLQPEREFSLVAYPE